MTGASHLQHIDSQLSGKTGNSGLKIIFVRIVYLIIYYLYFFGSIDSVRKTAIFGAKYHIVPLDKLFYKIKDFNRLKKNKKKNSDMLLITTKDHFELKNKHKLH